MSRYTITLGIPKPDLPAGREEWQTTAPTSTGSTARTA